MKPATLLCALGFAEMALAVPVPMTISDMMAHVKDEAHRLTRITRVSMHRLRPVAIIQESGDDKVEIVFDNRPISPSKVLPPSLVLAAPRPLKTNYLQSLAKHPKSGKERVVDVNGDGTPSTIKPQTLEDGLAELFPSRRFKPCWKTVQIPKPSMAVFEEHPDLIVLGAVIALVLVLLVLETVGTTFQGVRKHYSPPQGQIRLEGDEKSCKALSFRSDDMIPCNDEEDVGRQAL
ncbi:uncharacterized protein CTRU02_207342 [Colletotrichum truncatum]|uniref:Uncharacterized protein n=1 Tax=Colletotrichum truncatum TaxID=5467 RepID=A0ACC3Z0K5_COLTU|nr:uncharacterized protein CTRU02_01022 [Colletotrichum truncatum]KAF6800617.1 hypothetical protein CTRU02_01022 [Colletotrichum truncatum]